MNAPVTAALAFTAVTFWLIGAAWGASQQRRYENERYSRLVSADAGQRSVIRDLYAWLELEPPNFYEEDEPAEQPGWWRRVWGRLRRRPAVGAQPVNEAEEVPSEPAVDLEVGDEPTSSVAEPDEPERDWRTDTGPIALPPSPGPETQPTQAVIADDWQARSEQMLAEARAAIAELSRPTNRPR